MKKNAPSVSAIPVIAISSFVSSCAMMEPNPIPGARNNVVSLEGVEVSDVLSAVKLQMGRAINTVEALKKEKKGHPISKLHFKEGSGKLVATVKSIRGSSGALQSVIPFSGFDGSLITPDIGGDLSAESTRTEELAFKIDPKPDAAAVGGKDDQTVKMSDELYNAIVSKYEDLAKMPGAAKGRHGPPLTPQSLTMTFDFVAQQSRSGKLEVKFIPSSPSFDAVNAGIGGARQRTVSNQLTISLPFDTADNGDPRKLIYAVKDSEGVVYVEEPFTHERLDQLRKGVRVPKPPEEKPDDDRGPFFNRKMLIPLVPEGPKSSLLPEEDPAPF